MLPILDTHEIEANRDVLRAMVASGTTNIPVQRGLQVYALPVKHSTVEHAIDLLSKYGNTVLLPEVLKEEMLVEYCTVVDLIPTMVEIYSKWIDMEEFTSRPNNLLLKVGGPSDWERRFKEAITEFLCENGKVTYLHDGIYGWEDKSALIIYRDVEIVAAFNAKEDKWDEFENTIDGCTTHHGISVDVLYSNGHFRTLRYETNDLTSIIANI